MYAQIYCALWVVHYIVNEIMHLEFEHYHKMANALLILNTASECNIRYEDNQLSVLAFTETVCSAELSRLVRRRIPVKRTATTSSWSRWRIATSCPSRQTRVSLWLTAKSETPTTAGSTTPTPSGMKPSRRSMWWKHWVRFDCYIWTQFIRKQGMVLYVIAASLLQLIPKFFQGCILL